jgi:hypothetical protein
MKIQRKCLAATIGWSLTTPAWTQPPPSFETQNAAQHTHTAKHSPAIEFEAVFNTSWQSGAHALSHRDRGLGLGHSDISAEADLAPWLKGKLSAVAHSDHNKIDTRIEEGFLEAPALAGGLQARAGRFLSQLGYLNENHPHADDFVMRPLLHRAFLGGHYADQGARINWIAPTSIYWRMGAEIFQGRKLPRGYSSGDAGAYTLGTRVGGDLSHSASWQLGWSTLRHRPGAFGAAGDTHDHPAEGASTAETRHSDSHRATFFGRQIDIIEAVWKWAPDGNARTRQLRVSLEHARVGGFGDANNEGVRHTAWYLAAVYRFQANWEAGLRIDSLRAWALHEQSYEPARLDERSVSLAWKPDHMTTVRLQWTGQTDRGGFAEASDVKPGRAVHLQWVRSFGAHSAHSY